MSLWIRSQDRTILEQVTNIEYVEDNICSDFPPREDTRYYIGINNKKIIGEYSSKERALEVLDEIHSLIENYDCYYSKNMDAYITCKCVYEMPKD